MKRSTGIGVGVAVAAVALAAITLSRPRPVEVTVTAVAREPVQQSIANVQSGAVIPRESVHVPVMIMGVVEAIHVQPGDRVEQDALLLELEREELDARVRLAEATLNAARFQLSRLREQEKLKPSGSESAPDFSQNLAERHRQRVEELLNAPIPAAPDGDPQLPGSLSEMTFGQQHRVELAAFQVAQLESALALARVVRERAVIRAPIGGVVALPEARMPAMPMLMGIPAGANPSSELPRPGEAVGMGMPFLRIVDDSEFRVRAPFDEVTSVSVEMGQTAEIAFDTYRDRVFRGQVVGIAPVVSMNADMSRTLDVTLSLDDIDVPLLAGMSADVSIVVERKDDVIAVPTEAIVREQFVYIIENGRAQRRDVTLGVGNWQYREITAGLEAGETIVTNVTAPGLDDGVRVVEGPVRP
jgi:HlyD family secretion protein